MRAGRLSLGGWACTLCLALLLPCTGSGAATPPSKLVEWPLNMAAEVAAAAGGKVSAQAAANPPEEKAGFLATDDARKIFYYYFGARSSSGQAIAGAPLLVWINGGPGCSSLFGLFFENGPYTINQKGQAVANPNTWALAANMLYIDQPINTGLSYSTVRAAGWAAPVGGVEGPPWGLAVSLLLPEAAGLRDTCLNPPRLLAHLPACLPTHLPACRGTGIGPAARPRWPTPWSPL